MDNVSYLKSKTRLPLLWVFLVLVISVTCNYLVVKIEHGSDWLQATALYVVPAAIVFIFSLTICGRLELVKENIPIISKIINIFSFILYFCSSGYGIISTIIILFTGVPILKEEIDKAITSYDRLYDFSRSALRNEEYEKLSDRVKSDLILLKTEIYNPSGAGYCGVGNEAKKIIARMGTYLIGFSLISGTDIGHSCNNTEWLDTIYSKYNENARTLISNHPSNNYNKNKTTYSIQTDVYRAHDLQTPLLKDHLQQLSRMTFLFENYQILAQVTDDLRTASREYNLLYERTHNLNINMPSDLLLKMDISALEMINQPFGGGKLVLDRLLSSSPLIPLLIIITFLIIDFATMRGYQHITIIYSKINQIRRGFEALGHGVNLLINNRNE